MRFSRASGILLHPTSLPGRHGSGDFGAAAYNFVDWLGLAGQGLWQILPLGGVGPGNSPYMSSSAFAGNPLLVDLEELAMLGWLNADELQPLPGFTAQRVNYAQVIPYRMHRLRLAATRFLDHPSPQQEVAFAEFCDAEAEWLEDYALFMALEERYDGLGWAHWPPELASRKPQALLAARRELAAELDFWRFCQWCFFRQWRALKQYANHRGVRIVGDIPIFVAYQNADVWSHQALFELDGVRQPAVVAGVPPDYFSATGQRWGNPVYRWQAHADQDYAWWIQRLRKKFELVDIVRIDHFRGFAGYWEIPASEPTAINGRWMPGPGAKLFVAIQRALGEMPVIAEDLGIITPDVVELLRQFDFPGMRVLQFAFGGNSDNPYLPHNFVRNMVVYVGTHDNDTTLGWFNSASAQEREFVCKYLRTDGSAIHWDMIHAASQSVADLAIYSMQDVLGLGSEHRMNLPGRAEGYWEWRFDWAQVQAAHAQQLQEITVLHGRAAVS